MDVFSVQTYSLKVHSRLPAGWTEPIAMAVCPYQRPDGSAKKPEFALHICAYPVRLKEAAVMVVSCANLA
jgi:hypothetical protein